MAYEKPGIVITQIQKTVGPNLITPDLLAAVVGPAYKVVGFTDYTYGTAYNSTTGTVVNLSGLDSNLYLDADSVYVDLFFTSGSNYGTRYHVATLSGVTDGGTSVGIAAGTTSMNGAAIYVGYRALRKNANQVYAFEGPTDLDNVFGYGSVNTFNPLGLAVQLALANSGNKSVFGYGVRTDEFAGVTGSGTTSSEHTLALDALSTKDVYVYAPVSQDSSVLSAYRTEVTALSVPEEKKERITVQNPEIPWSGTPTTAQRATVAGTIRDNALAIQNKRAFLTFPDVVYIRESGRHISTLGATYLNNQYGLGTHILAKLAKDVTFDSNHPNVAYRGKTIYAGGEIDSTLYTLLSDNPKDYKYDVLVPVPGAMLPAAIAGQISNAPPSQGLTNLPITGFQEVKYSSDYFSESQLNTIATGGNYIMWQGNLTSAISCRHQLSTDMSSVEKRELSITKTVDFVAKFIRKSISPYIGRYTIDAGFLTILTSSINSLGASLVRDGHLNSFKLSGLVQDDVNKDTIRATIEIQPKYPVNYIKIDLIF